MTTRPCFSSGSNGNARPRETARLKAIDGCEMHCYNIVARGLFYRRLDGFACRSSSTVPFAAANETQRAVHDVRRDDVVTSCFV
jgi:hypothetical protein